MPQLFECVMQLLFYDVLSMSLIVGDVVCSLGRTTREGRSGNHDPET